MPEACLIFISFHHRNNHHLKHRYCYPHHHRNSHICPRPVRETRDSKQISTTAIGHSITGAPPRICWEHSGGEPTTKCTSVIASSAVLPLVLSTLSRWLLLLLLLASIAVAAAVDSPQPAQVHLLQTDANQSPAPVAAVT